MDKQLAVIKNFNIGVGDRGRPAIWFSTYISESTAALQVIEGQEAIYEFINNSRLTDITKIEGKTCWVEVDGSRIKFLRMATL